MHPKLPKYIGNGCVVVLWHNESVNVNPGLSFSAWYSLA